jgi:hypothetical protein
MRWPSGKKNDVSGGDVAGLAGAGGQQHERVLQGVAAAENPLTIWREGGREAVTEAHGGRGIGAQAMSWTD